MRETERERQRDRDRDRPTEGEGERERERDGERENEGKIKQKTENIQNLNYQNIITSTSTKNIIKCIIVKYTLTHSFTSPVS